MGHKKPYLKAGLLWLTTTGGPRKRTFTLHGRTYDYFSHFYNLTWLNERRVEIPIIRDAISQRPGATLLEIGNVLSHYDPTLTHPVVDKYERSRRGNLFTEDVETFQRGGPYDLIISISTLEHVGWDEVPQDRSKIGRVIRHLRGLLKPTGELIFTAPVGYSPPLDRLVDEGEGFLERLCLRRVNARNEWEQTEWSAIRTVGFHAPYPFANGLIIARLAPL